LIKQEDMNTLSVYGSTQLTPLQDINLTSWHFDIFLLMKHLLDQICDWPISAWNP